MMAGPFRPSLDSMRPDPWPAPCGSIAQNLLRPVHTPQEAVRKLLQRALALITAKALELEEQGQLNPHAASPFPWSFQ